MGSFASAFAFNSFTFFSFTSFSKAAVIFALAFSRSFFFSSSFYLTSSITSNDFAFYSASLSLFLTISVSDPNPSKSSSYFLFSASCCLAIISIWSSYESFLLAPFFPLLLISLRAYWTSCTSPSRVLGYGEFKASSLALLIYSYCCIMSCSLTCSCTIFFLASSFFPWARSW